LKNPDIFPGYGILDLQRDLPKQRGCCPITKRYLPVILLFLFTAVIMSPARVDTSTNICNIPVIINADGPAVIQYDRDGQVGNTRTFPAETSIEFE
jgi:hypothetical protein